MKNVLKKLTKTAAQVLSLNNINKGLINGEFIGNGYIAIKKGIIKTIDTGFNNLIEKGYDLKDINITKLIPRFFKSDMEKVESIEVKKTLTKLESKNITTYLNTTYYMFLNSHIKDMELYIKSPVDAVIISSTCKNDDNYHNALGIVLPMRVKNIEEFENDLTLEEYAQELQKEDDNKKKLKEYEEKDIQESLNHLIEKFKVTFDIFKDNKDEKIIKITYKKLKDCYRFIVITNKKEYEHFNVCDYNLNLGLRTQKKILDRILPTLENMIIENNKKDNEINDLSLEVAADTENKNDDMKSNSSMEGEHVENYLYSELNLNNMLNHIEKVNNLNNEILGSYGVQQRGTYRIYKQDNKMYIKSMLETEDDCFEKLEIFEDTDKAIDLYIEFLAAYQLDYMKYLEDNKSNKNDTPSIEIIEKWNNKLNTNDKIKHQLDVLNRVIARRKKESPLLNFVPVNGYIISKILQSQNIDIQYNKNDFKKCYYVLKDSTLESIKVAFKDMDDVLHYYNVNTNSDATMEGMKEEFHMDDEKIEPIKMSLQLLASAACCEKEVLKETEDYIIFKKDNVYTVRYFDECKGNIKYNRNKEVIQSRVTKNYDSIKHLLQDHNLRIIYNDMIKGHKEYQEQQLEKYNSGTLNFDKKRITDKMIEEFTKYFVYDDNSFMSVKPSISGCYPGGYYEHVRSYNLLVDINNKIMLCTCK